MKKSQSSISESKGVAPTPANYSQLAGIIRQNNNSQFRKWLDKHRGQIDLSYPIAFNGKNYELWQLINLPEHLPLFMTFMQHYSQNPNTIIKGGPNALQLAAKEGKLSFLKFYFKLKPEFLRETTANKLNLLHCVATNPANTEEMVNFLIKEVKLDPNAVTEPRGRTAAFYAQEYGALAVLKALYKNGANIELKDKLGFTGRELAEAKGHQPILNYLDLVSKEKSSPEIAFNMAIDFQDFEKVRQLRPQVKDINQLVKLTNITQTALHRATDKNNVPIVRYLLDEKADVNLGSSESNTPLILAAEAGYETCAQTLIEYKADLNAQAQDRRTALYGAVTQGHDRIVSLLVTAKADVHYKLPDGSGYLHIAAQTNKAKVTEELLTTDIEVNHRNNQDLTALQSAVFKNKMVSVIKLKSDPRVDADICSPTCPPVTHLSIQANDQHMLKTLLELKVNPNQVNHQGYFAIAQAVALNNLAALELLKKYQAWNYGHITQLLMNTSFLLNTALNFKVDSSITDYLLKNFEWTIDEKCFAAGIALLTNQRKTISKILPEIKQVNKKSAEQLEEEINAIWLGVSREKPAVSEPVKEKPVLSEDKKEIPLNARSFLAKEKGYTPEEIKAVMQQQKAEAKKFKDLAFKPGIRLWADVQHLLVIPCSWFNGLLNQDSKELHTIEKNNIPNSFLYIDPKLAESKDPAIQALLDKQRWCFNNENGLKSLENSPYTTQYCVNDGPTQKVKIEYEITTRHKNIGHARLLVFKVDAEQGQGALFVATLELFAVNGLGEKVFHPPDLVNITILTASSNFQIKK